VALRAYSAWLDIDLHPYKRPQARRRALPNLALVAALALLVLLTLAILVL
jgi:hypothetical protein